MAEEPAAEHRPQRTSEEIAHKQTEMLSRELELTDSLQRDSIYRIHLRYIRMRMQSNTRAEELKRMLSLYSELEKILTAEQYDRFMNKQLTTGPRQQHNNAMVGTPLQPRAIRSAVPRQYPQDNAPQDTSANSN